MTNGRELLLFFLKLCTLFKALLLFWSINMTFSKQNLSFLSLVGAIAVSGCAYSPAATSQKVTFLAPDVEGVHCDVSVDEREYHVDLPETLDIKMSSDGMKLSCITDDNRVLEQDFAPDVTTRAVWGGAKAWDYDSASTYKYPSVVSLDFSGIQPQEYMSVPADDIKSDVKEVENQVEDMAVETDNGESNDDQNVNEGEPVDLQEVIDDLAEDQESQAVDNSADEAKEVLEAETQPVSIYPGQ